MIGGLPEGAAAAIAREACPCAGIGANCVNEGVAAVTEAVAAAVSTIACACARWGRVEGEGLRPSKGDSRAGTAAAAAAAGVAALARANDAGAGTTVGLSHS